VLLGGAVDDGVREVEDRLRRAVVLLELDDPGTGNRFGKSMMFRNVAPRTSRCSGCRRRPP
jgi:hypothetical protein